MNNGEQKYFITGFEAGAHTVWQFVFQHPERLKAAAPVSGNYNQNSCMSEEAFSKNPSLIQLPVKGFSGSIDTLYGSKGPVYYQWKNALQAVTAHGYKNISEMIIAGKGHEDYQIIGREVLHFDDKEVARAALAQRN